MREGEDGALGAVTIATSLLKFFVLSSNPRVLVDLRSSLPDPATRALWLTEKELGEGYPSFLSPNP